VGLKTSPPSVSRLSRKCGCLDVSQPYGHSWPATGIALLFIVSIYYLSGSSIEIWKPINCYPANDTPHLLKFLIGFLVRITTLQSLRKITKYIISHDVRCPYWDSNRTPPKYNPETLHDWCLDQEWMEPYLHSPYASMTLCLIKHGGNC
jgi:hypothetical protein